MIDGDDVFGALSKQLGEGSLARTEVGDDVVVEDLEKTLREGCLLYTSDAADE